MRASLVFAVTLSLLAAPAVAEEGGGEESPVLLMSFFESGDSPRLFGHVPVAGARAAAFSTSRLSLFAEGDSRAFGVDAPIHTIEGGAAFRLPDEWRLTAGYRVSGRLGSAGSGSIDVGMAAPFLKLGMDF